MMQTIDPRQRRGNAASRPELRQRSGNEHVTNIAATLRQRRAQHELMRWAPPSVPARHYGSHSSEQ